MPVAQPHTAVARRSGGHGQATQLITTTGKGNETFVCSAVSAYARARALTPWTMDAFLTVFCCGMLAASLQSHNALIACLRISALAVSGPEFLCTK
ncbi:hypothetical protein CSOJ01_12254 [Colletotrichum sojae]|uniref:Uncharacterized protein n=1 Tax=Colletotrichum sojae TaxID=2175907 RepID=A0A8H6MMU3_9PEZI|nr:hypothetical protein CSOJ01_12254 [Colletotrichum sojae]